MTTPLTGGRLTPGVVRIGETVRRPANPFTADLLHLLEQRGLTCVPRHLGQDAEGRDILTYVEGWVPARFQRWTDNQITAAARLLRTFHDATRGTILAAPHDVICHHDFGPNNVVFRDNIPVAFIDFDLAAPGNILEDIGYMAWTWCISSKHPPKPQAAQLKVLVDAYGLTTPQRHALVDAILARQLHNAHFWTTTTADVTPAQRSDRITWSHHEHTFTTTHRKTFEQAITGGRLS
jgi:Ser/Thr protein kinase RdoA (MazF antagonist)